ncbi:hypothetical protein SBRCBS47491_009077 [Sporothrix bragantina]|uniref:Uncharacterized protein n=1 Tax=Sporothrix bragantina TaxID=671064 RepID=A0ABP0CUU9_9PEZI
MNFGSRVEFSTNNYSVAFSKVPLPCSESFYASGMKDVDKRGDGSVFAELVRGIKLWSDSGTATQSQLSLYSRQVSAQLAFEHAQAVSQLVKLSQRRYKIDPDRIPSFVSYAAYSACAVQIPFFWCSNQDVQTRARSNVLMNLRGINSWTLYKTLSRNPPRLNDEPKFMDSSMLDFNWLGTDRAAKSIMSYSEIVWQSAGSYVERTDAEITDLGLSSRSRPSSVPPADDAVTSLIDELSSSATTTVTSTSAGPTNIITPGNAVIHDGAFSNDGTGAAGLGLSPPTFDTNLDFFMPCSPNDGVGFVEAQTDMSSSQQLASFNTWLQQIESEMLFHSPL